MAEPSEPVQHFRITARYDADGHHRSDGYVEVTRHSEGDNLASVTIDDGEGNRVTVLMGWRETASLMAALGAVAVHM